MTSSGAIDKKIPSYLRLSSPDLHVNTGVVIQYVSDILQCVYKLITVNVIIKKLVLFW